MPRGQARLIPRPWAWPGAEMYSRKIDARKRFYLSFTKFTSLEKYALYGTSASSTQSQCYKSEILPCMCCLPHRTAPTDYTAAPGATLTFGPGKDRDCTTIEIVNDPLVEGEESFTVTLQSTDPDVNTGPPDSATIIIRDDDSKNMIFFHKKYGIC